MLIKIMKIRIDELAVYLVVPIIGFLFGTILLAGFIYMDVATEALFPAGTTMAIALGIITPVFTGIFILSQLFWLEIGFGVSRKKFFIYDVLVSVIFNTIVAAVIIVLNAVEEILIKKIYGAKNLVIEFHLIQYIPWILLIVICVAVLRELLGAIVLKYGTKVITLIWAVFMLCCLVPQRFAEYAAGQKSGILVELYKSIADRFYNLGMESYGIMGVVFSGAALGILWLIIRKQAVQG